ncbi:hypothetical protein IMSAGC020_01196 [Lachnospiraceae bacterium]|nr:hypothetical protein IMSAGC020_01196 [Lachnospiraceae bacterium]
MEAVILTMKKNRKMEKDGGPDLVLRIFMTAMIMRQ